MELSNSSMEKENVVCVHNGIIAAIKKNGVKSFTDNE